MTEKKVEIVNKLGLHLRAAAALVQQASRFKSHIELKRDARSVNAKSIMGVMSLAASQGVKLVIQCDGADEAEALKALVDMVQNKFGEAV